MSATTRLAELEQKYIELLEKKIARLENEKIGKDEKPTSLVSRLPPTIRYRGTQLNLYSPGKTRHLLRKQSMAMIPNL